MAEIVTVASRVAVGEAAQLLHDFSVEYDEPAPPTDELADRLAELLEDERFMILLARARETGPSDQVEEAGRAVGVALVRLTPSVLSRAEDAYLAALYVVPGRRGQGYGRELITESMQRAKEHGAEYAFLITTEDDRLAQRLYDAAGFRRTEGEGGPLMLAYERDLKD